MKSIINRVLYRLGIKKEKKLTKVEQCRARGVKIGDNVFIGYGSIILPNTTIGNKVIVGAGTVVSKNVPDNVVIVGNPYRIICSYDSYMERMKKDMEIKPVSNTLFYDNSDEQNAGV